MSERRRAPRREIWQPVNINTTERRDRVGVIRDMSQTGVLFHSRSRFAIGEQLTVMYRIDKKVEGHAIGHVVRAFRDSNEDTMFPYLTAIRFNAPTPLPKSA